MTDSLSVDLNKRIIKDNLKAVREKILLACDVSGRDIGEISLMAVTKTVAPEIINIALDEGVNLIGENRVQEFLAKKDKLNLSDTDTHLIGHLQTNKVNQIVGNVSCIQSVDRVKLARLISNRSKELGIVTDVLVQVKMGDEDSKSGVAPEHLLPLLHEISELDGISVRGLMTIPPIYETETQKRAIFSQMYKLFVDIKDKNVDNIYMHTLSMGMSNDFYEAILEGANLVRIGSSIFGHRI